MTNFCIQIDVFPNYAAGNERYKEHGICSYYYV